MTRWTALLCLAVVVASVGTTAHSQSLVQAESPEEIVRTAAEAVLQSLNGRREFLEANPVALREVVDEVFLPRFDKNYAAYLVLGRHGRSANAEQKARFATALYNYISSLYAHGLLKFTTDRVQILPHQSVPGEDKATVRSFVILDSGTSVPVNYDLRRGSEGWKLYDVTIEGISYVRNLRSQIGAEIEQSDLDSVIRNLESQASGQTDTPSVFP